MTKAILLLMVVCFPFSRELMLDPANLQPWQFVTYAFAHGSLGHLALNALTLLSFGTATERVVGPWNLLAILGVGVLAGALAFNTQPMMGMSAGILAVVTFYAMHKPEARVWLLVVPMPAWYAVMAVMVLSVAAAAFGWVSGVAHLAHLLGMAGGTICHWQWERVNGR